MIECTPLRVDTIVSRASAHGRSTINPHFSPHCTLTLCIRHLQCVKIEIGRVDYYGRGPWHLLARYAHTRMHALYRAHLENILGKVGDIQGKNSPMYS